MASGTLAGDESRVKHRWGDNNKVYTRKNHKKGIKNNDNTNTINNTTNNNSVPEQSSQTLATTTEDGNSSQHQQQQQQQQQNLSRSGGVSEDLSSHNPAEVTMANGVESINGNGLNSVFTRFENRVKVNVSAARSKSEVGDVRRKLAGELELVRSLVKKLEAKEVQLNGYSNVGGYSRLQVPENEDVDRGGGPLLVNSEVGSVGHCDSRPFHGLSVVVTENSHDGGNDNRTPNGIGNQYYPNSEFVFGRDKFPPPGSNKKLKPNGFGLGMQLNKAFKSCSNLLTRLVKHKNSWIFKAPVDVEALKLHDYHAIIKHPMDLGTIRTRLTKNWYKSPREFAEDVRLTFCNAMTYNPKGHDVHTMAEEFLKIFEEKWAVIEAEYSLDWMSDMSHDRDLPTPTSRKVPTPHPLPLAPPSQVRTLESSLPLTTLVDSRMETTRISPPGLGRKPAPKKPKAKNPRKRDMTYEEKQKLSINLQSLPSEKLDNIVQIIKKRNSELCQHDDEIEVDIDNVDAETLWELDRFVSNYKKSLSKLKRKAEIALQTRHETDHTIQNMNPVPVVVVEVEAPKETREDAEKVSASVQGDKQGDDEGGSSSSSSSSDSGSSSSDSDSGSSSTSGSDPGFRGVPSEVKGNAALQFHFASTGTCLEVVVLKSLVYNFQPTLLQRFWVPFVLKMEPYDNG